MLTLQLLLVHNYLSLINSFRMISEGSCDNEDWSNGAENSALLHRNELHFKIFYNKN